jgi:hypothetical protein
VLETLAQQRGSLESLAGLLKVKEVVDRSVLLDLLASTAVGRAAPVAG